MTEYVEHLTTPQQEAFMRTNPKLDENKEKNTSIAFSHHGEKAHILFGHGLQHDDVTAFLISL